MFQSSKVIFVNVGSLFYLERLKLFTSLCQFHIFTQITFTACHIIEVPYTFYTSQRCIGSTCFTIPIRRSKVKELTINTGISWNAHFTPHSEGNGFSHSFSNIKALVTYPSISFMVMFSVSPFSLVTIKHQLLLFLPLIRSRCNHPLPRTISSRF